MKAFSPVLRLCSLLCAAVLAAAPLAAQAPLTLFNGVSLLGWSAHGQWTASGGIMGTSGTLPRSIMTAVPFGDFNLIFDYNESATMGARFRIGAPKTGTGGTYIDLDGTKPGVGGIEGAPPSRIASTSDGQWHHVNISSSNGQVAVHVDGQNGGVGAGGGTGYLGWEVSGNGNMSIRNVKLTPLNLVSAFNNADLGQWKNVQHTPHSGKGVGHDIGRTLSFGAAGGSKPHNAKWAVQGGAIHGEDGPGGLEYSTPFEDGLIQVMAGMKGSIKPEHYVSLDIRGTAGQLEGGYPVGIGPFAGSIGELAHHSLAAGNPVDETIVVGSRTIAVWVAGNLYTVYTDSRPDAQNVAQGARVAAGTATFSIPNDVQLDVKSVSITPFAAHSGSGPAGPRPGTPDVTAAAATSTQGAGNGAAAGGGGGGGGGGGSNAAEAALLAQQKAAAKQADDDRAAKQRVATLMSLALSSTDPKKQEDYYSQVIAIDPSNAPAVQGYKDAQAKVQAADDAANTKVATEINVAHESLTKDQQVQSSLLSAQSAFLAGHIAQASSALLLAERLAPENPLVRDLRTRINATNSLHSRLFYLSGGTGILALLTACGLWFRRRGQQRFPMLEVTDGLDAGQHFPIEKDIVRIGAVAQDGGQKNDVVLRDVDRAISRFHCEIAKKNGQLYLTDLKSSNGTKLNGEPIPPNQPMLLKKGARILLADAVEMQFGYDRRSTNKNDRKQA